MAKAAKNTHINIFHNKQQLHLTLLASEHELTRVHALRSRQQSINLLESVGVLELDLGNGSTSARVVDDVLDNTLHVTMLLSKVVSLHADSTLSADSVCLEDRSLSFTATANNLSHG